MILLTSTSDILRVVTGTTGSSINVHASYVDNASGTITPGRTNTAAITTNTTTTIVAAPSSGVQRNVRGVYITNNHATVSTQVTVQHYDGTTSEDLFGVMLLPGENLVLNEEGEWTHHDANGADYAYSASGLDPLAVTGISGTIAETIPRILCSEANLSALTSGTLYMTAIYLRAGQTVTNISYFSATTAAGTPTAGRFALYDGSRNLLAQTADFTTEAWAANTIKTKPLTASYKITLSGLYYVGILIVATTVPTLKGLTAKTASQLAGTAPILHGNSSTGLTTTLPNPAAAITAGVNAVWAAIT
ncbi:MAG: hypothetical protein ACKO0Z_05805 [Betaproteobacteria bacterium]